MHINKVIASVFLFAFIALCACNMAIGKFELKSGDLLFSVGKGDSELLTAIQNSTSQSHEIPFSHVGIVSVEESGTFILEATSPEGVVKTTLDDFFEKTATLDGKTLIAVGRVRNEHGYAVSNAVKNAEKHLGKNYDYAYDETNNAFYCSELVRFSFTDSLGNPIFESLAMSFKNRETSEFEPYWTAHFQKLGKPIPEGAPGTNPADMAKSLLIKIVHTYY